MPSCRPAARYSVLLGMLLGVFCLLTFAARQATADKPEPTHAAQILFRCDAMSVKSRPTRTFCRKNVVLYHQDLWICCDLLRGSADDAGHWQTLTCQQNVRAQRRVKTIWETVWAGNATLSADQNTLVLTDKPVLQRGDTWLEGERVMIDLHAEQARIVRPRGRVAASYAEPSANPAVRLPPTTPLTAALLPSRCPIPALKL